jgi:hypothetical protein
LAALSIVDFDVDFGDTRQQALLHVCDRLVVDRRADFLEEEAEEGAGRDVADLLLHVFAEIAFDGGHGLGADFLGQFNAHCGCAPGCWASTVTT